MTSFSSTTNNAETESPSATSHLAATFDSQTEPSSSSSLSFAISHASSPNGFGSNEDFVPRGLRSFFAYRDLGVGEATKGKWGAHLIKKVGCCGDFFPRKAARADKPLLRHLASSCDLLCCRSRDPEAQQARISTMASIFISFSS